MTPERNKEIIEIWKTVVGVQMHFNDISMRIRGMFVTILLALFASIGFMLDKKLTIEFVFVHVQFAMLVPLFGIFGACLFYFIDRYWYHRLLVGSVKHAMKIEESSKVDIPELSLSNAIGVESPYKPRGLARWIAICVVNDEKFRKTKILHSDGKIELFYKSVIMLLLIAFVLIGIFGGVTLKDRNTKEEQSGGVESSGLPSVTLPADVRQVPEPASQHPSQIEAPAPASDIPEASAMPERVKDGDQ